MKDRQKTTKAKCERDESPTKQSIFVEYSLPYKKHLSFAGARSQINTTLYQNVKLNKFVFATSWLLDLLCKHWCTSSVWNFCRWVADVRPRETSPAAKSKEKRLFCRLLHQGNMKWGEKEERNRKCCRLFPRHVRVRPQNFSLRPGFLSQILCTYSYVLFSFLPSVNSDF